MGYPMTYPRVVGRNNLDGDYENDGPSWPGEAAVAGDLRRLESDQRDDTHLALYAKAAGVTPEQARLVLDA